MESKNTVARIKPIPNNHPLNPSLYKAITNAVKPIKSQHLEC